MGITDVTAAVQIDGQIYPSMAHQIDTIREMSSIGRHFSEDTRSDQILDRPEQYLEQS
jgi:hypothetical protein